MINQGFHKIFGGGDLLSGRIFGPHGGWSQMEGLASGMELDEGGLGKIVR